MNFFNKTALAASLLLLSGTALANNMFINTSNAAYGTPSIAGSLVDANTTTGIFNEFGFSQLLTTSVYDFSDGSINGAFYDTNRTSDLTFANVPASGLALDGMSMVNLTTPLLSQRDVDALSPLIPPLASDAEGFLTQWDLQLEYFLPGTFGPGGPVYDTSGAGTIEIFVRDIATNTLTSVVKATLISAVVEPANLLLGFEITVAAEDYLNIFNPITGLFEDANDLLAAGGKPLLIVDTNVNPPLPTADQLLLVLDDSGNPNAIRQSTFDGSATAAIPEPSTIALVGLGLLGLGLGAKRRKA